MWRSLLGKRSLFERAAAHNTAWWVNQQLGCWQYPAIKATIKFRVTLQWIWQVVLTLGRGTRAPGPIHLSLSRVIQKNLIERMVDERRGKEAWGHLLAANLAKDSSTGAKHICVSMWSFFFFFLLLYWHGRRWIISRIQGLTSPVWVLGSKEKKNNVVAVHQKLAKHCEY